MIFQRQATYRLEAWECKNLRKFVFCLIKICLHLTIIFLVLAEYV